MDESTIEGIVYVLGALELGWYAMKGYGHYVNIKRISRGEEKGGLFPIEYERKLTLLPFPLEFIYGFYDASKILLKHRGEEPLFGERKMSDPLVEEAYIQQSRKLW